MYADCKLRRKLFFRLTFYPFYLFVRYTSSLNTYWTISKAIKKAKQDENDSVIKELSEIAESLKGNILKQAIALILMVVAMLVVHLNPEAREDLPEFLQKNSDILIGFIVSWFVITFASVRKIFLSDATLVTFFMFSVFSIILGLKSLDIIYYTSNLGLRIIGVALLYFVWFASSLYDHVDFLKAGLDEAALEYYKKARKALPVQIVKDK